MLRKSGEWSEKAVNDPDTAFKGSLINCVTRDAAFSDQSFPPPTLSKRSTFSDLASSRYFSCPISVYCAPRHARNFLGFTPHIPLLVMRDVI